MATDEKESVPSNGRWLAAVPIGVAVLFLALLMPRATTPEDVPLPSVDTRVVEQVERQDAARVRAARAARLPSDILAIGSGIRAINRAQVANDADAAQAARLETDAALRAALGRPGMEDDVASLRALQMQAFVDELARFERTGEETIELREVGGRFVERARSVGWIEGRHVLLDEHAQRVAFKLVWNGLTFGDAMPKLAVTLDEQRTLYAFYLTHPHPGEASLPGALAELRAAKTDEACARARANAARAAELWRADKIQRLGAIDPAYPTKYALGVAYYRAGRYGQAVDAFRAFVDAHPDGQLALRARNHLKASVAAYGTY